MLLTIKNNHQEIIASNYRDYQLPLYAVSPNAGAIRLLVPEVEEENIPDILNRCDHVIVSTIPNPKIGRLSLEILFEDHSDTPYSISICPELIIGLYPKADETPVERKLTIWINGPTKVATLKVFTRKVPSLPCLKPLDWKIPTFAPNWSAL